MASDQRGHLDLLRHFDQCRDPISRLNPTHFKQIEELEGLLHLLESSKAEPRSCRAWNRGEGVRGSPWPPVQTPFPVQKRLMKDEKEEGDYSGIKEKRVLQG